MQQTEKDACKAARSHNEAMEGLKAGLEEAKDDHFMNLLNECRSVPNYLRGISKILLLMQLVKFFY